MPYKCVQIIIKGIVQGVFFRKFTKLKAGEVDISGFVKNLPDGSVYIEAKGSSENLERFIKWCYSGPTHAKVTSVQVIKIPVKQFTGFDISYF